MDIKLLLLSPEGEIRQAYHDVINKLGVQYDTVSSFKELYNAMAKVSYHGIMIDLNAKLRAPKDELGPVKKILERFPVAELRWDKDTKIIGLFYQGQSKDGGNLEDFINRICRPSNATIISTENRSSVNFNVLLAKTNDFSAEKVERTITINVSRGGCFIFSTNKWNINDDAWIIIKDINDQTPIRGEVRWAVEWDKGIQVPGIGLLFKEIKEPQVAEICIHKPQEETR
jgi:Tfp pilus assembly protein PilZ